MVAGMDYPLGVFPLLALAEAVPLRPRRWYFDEAVQDLWLVVLDGEVPDDVEDDPRRLAAWLRIALKHRMIDLVREERRRRQVQLDAHPFSFDDPSAELLQTEIVTQVRATLIAMQEKGAARAADLLKWRFLEGKSVGEIAALLGIEPRKVTYRLRHAKEAFVFHHAQRGGGGRKLRSRQGNDRRIFRATFPSLGRLYGWRRRFVARVRITHEAQARQHRDLPATARLSDGRDFDRLGHRAAKPKPRRSRYWVQHGECSNR